MQILIILFFFGAERGNCDETSHKLPQFGRPLRSEWSFDPDFIQLSHGSAGPITKEVQKALQECLEHSEKNGDFWQHRESRHVMLQVRRLLSDLVHAEADDIVILPTASGAFTAILNSIPFQPGERILHMSTIFISTEAVIRYTIDRFNGSISTIVFNVTYPLSNDQVVANFETFLEKVDDPKRLIRLAIVDHIQSMPSIVNHLDKIIPILKRYNITVAIDGAHAIGQIPINITALDPDYYVTNCHKWLFVARPTTLLYVKKIHQGSIHPPVISNYYRQPSDFQEEFFYMGTTNYCPYTTVPAALQFRKNVGGEEAIMEYNHNLARQGGLLMASKLGTKILQTEEQVGAMINVQLPLNNLGDHRLNFEWLRDLQFYKHNKTYMPIFMHDGYWWARVSAQIYNDITDFEVGAQHLREICEDLNVQNLTGITTARPKSSEMPT